MNVRGHYGSPRIGVTPDDLRGLARTLEPRSVFYDPKLFNDPETARASEKVFREHPTRTWAILAAAGVAIVGIGIVGAKRGVKFM